MWENTTPSTELPRDFCAGIGPLQLGVVLVIQHTKIDKTSYMTSYKKKPRKHIVYVFKIRRYNEDILRKFIKMVGGLEIKS